MKHTIILAFVLLPLLMHAQLDYRARINVYDCILAQAPNGQMALASDEVYVSPSPSNDWAKATAKPDQTNRLYRSRKSHLCWAGNDTLISGDDKGIIIYVRNNGNRFEQSGNQIGNYVDALHSNGRGKVWYCSIDQSMNYTDDCGKSWTKTPLFSNSESKDLNTGCDQRVADVYFTKDDKTGIIGTCWNILYVTTDNCKTFERIATPLDQKCYSLRYKHQQPRFNKVRIIGDYYVVSQNDKVYFTSSRQIEWKPLKGVVQFEVSDDNHLIMAMKDNIIRRLDCQLQLVDEYPIPEEAVDAQLQCFSNTLYACRNGVLYEIGHDGVKCYELLRNDERIDIINGSKPHGPIDIKGKSIYVDNHDLYLQDNRGMWYRYLSLGGKNVIKSETFVDDDFLYFYHYKPRGKELYCVDLHNLSVTPYHWPQQLFADKTVTAIQFCIKSTGCFHQAERDVIFKLEGNEFKWKKEAIYGMKNVLESMNLPSIPHTSIEASSVQQLSQMIDLSRNHLFALTDTLITNNDLHEFKQLLRKLMQEDAYNNLDYDKYAHDGDNMQSLDQHQLRDIAGRKSSWGSTTTETFSLKFVFEDGTIMTCSNSDYIRNYTLAPWSVKYGNLEYETDCLLIGQKIDELVGGTFIPSPYNSKAYAIFQMVQDRIE